MSGTNLTNILEHRDYMLDVANMKHWQGESDDTEMTNTLCKGLAASFFQSCWLKTPNSICVILFGVVSTIGFFIDGNVVMKDDIGKNQIDEMMES